MGPGNRVVRTDEERVCYVGSGMATMKTGYAARRRIVRSGPLFEWGRSFG
jgi:hypothetical protein